MASIYPLKPGELFEVPKDDKVTICKMCLAPAQPGEDIDLGPLYQYGNPIEGEEDEVEVYSAHYYCLLFAPALNQNGEDNEGIKGFLPKDIIKEWRRGRQLKCTYCGKGYATVGCCHKSCKRTYHLCCGIQNGTHQEFCGTFESFCPTHKPQQKVYHSKDKSVFNSKRECGMCFEDIKPINKVKGPEESKHIWTSCCNKWFHKTCMQHLAYNAGYFFKCPMCNNKEEFEEEMKRFGIYVPEQDAAWEREGNIFDGIYERHGTCDAETCLCPHGREYDVDYTEYEIILCKYCGAQGIHVKCGNLPLEDKVYWKCQLCKEVVKKLPPRTKHSFTKVKVKQSGKKSASNGMKQILTKLTLKVGSNSKIHASSKSFNASVDICPNYEIPHPVQLGTREDGLDPATKAFEKHVQSTTTFSPILALRPIPISANLKLPQSPQTTPRKNIGAKRKIDEETNPIIIKKEKTELCKDDVDIETIKDMIQTPSWKARIKGGTPKKRDLSEGLKSVPQTPPKKIREYEDLKLCPPKLTTPQKIRDSEDLKLCPPKLTPQKTPSKSPRKSPQKQYKEDFKMMKQKSILNYFGNNSNTKMSS